jgi:hypothetical protein
MPLIKVDAQGLRGRELEIAVEKDIDRFNTYFVKLDTPVAKADAATPQGRYWQGVFERLLATQEARHEQWVADGAPPQATQQV